MSDDEPRQDSSLPPEDESFIDDAFGLDELAVLYDNAYGQADKSPVVPATVAAQWDEALQAALAHFAQTPPLDYGYNESQEPWNGPRAGASGALIWTGNTMDSQIRNEVRRRFIAERRAQGHACCPHGLGFETLGGEITTQEYVLYYNMCPCCSSVLKRADDDGAGNELGKAWREYGPRDERTGHQSVYCEFCCDDRLLVDDTSEEGAAKILEDDGWKRISYEEAEAKVIERWDPLGPDRDYPVVRPDVFVYHNCIMEIEAARALMREGTAVQLWRNNRRAREALFAHEAHYDLGIDQAQREGRQADVERLQKQQASEHYVWGAMIFETGGALNWIAYDRQQWLGPGSEAPPLPPFID